MNCPTLLHKHYALLLTLAAVLCTPPIARAQPASDVPYLRIEPGMHTAIIVRIATDRDGRYLVTVSDDKSARVWDLGDGRLLQVLRVPIGEDDEGKLYAVALSPDGSLVAVGGFTGPPNQSWNIYIFDRATSRLIRRIGDLPEVVKHLVFASDGRLLAASLHSSGIRVFDVATGAERFRDTDYKDQSYSVDFDPAGQLVATGDDGELRLYDTSLRRIAKLAVPGGKQPFLARFSPDGRRIAVGF